MKKWEVSAPVSRATEVCKTQAGWTFYSPRCTALWQDTADPSNDSPTLVACLVVATQCWLQVTHAHALPVCVCACALLERGGGLHDTDDIPCRC